MGRTAHLLRLRQFYTGSRLMTQERSAKGAFCRIGGMAWRQRRNFLSLVNALFTTLGEMCACRLPVVILYRIFHGFSERGENPGKLVFHRGMAARSPSFPAGTLGKLAESQPF
jgi:hypothetical protein